MDRDKFKRYFYNKLKGLNPDEQYNLLSEARIAIESITSELNHECVYCENCRQHFVKDACEQRIEEKQKWEADDENDDNFATPGKFYKQKILYRICPKCGRNDLYDRLLSLKYD